MPAQFDRGVPFDAGPARSRVCYLFQAQPHGPEAAARRVLVNSTTVGPLFSRARDENPAIGRRSDWLPILRLADYLESVLRTAVPPPDVVLRCN
jgi:hypothetical protein